MADICCSSDSWLSATYDGFAPATIADMTDANGEFELSGLPSVPSKLRRTWELSNWTVAGVVLRLPEAWDQH